MQVIIGFRTLQSRTLGRLQGRETPIGIIVPLPQLPVDAVRLDHGRNAPPRGLTTGAAEGRGGLWPWAQGKGAPLNLQLLAVAFLQAMEANRRRITPGSEVIREFDDMHCGGHTDL